MSLEEKRVIIVVKKGKRLDAPCSYMLLLIFSILLVSNCFDTGKAQKLVDQEGNFFCLFFIMSFPFSHTIIREMMTLDPIEEIEVKGITEVKYLW